MCLCASEELTLPRMSIRQKHNCGLGRKTEGVIRDRTAPKCFLWDCVKVKRRQDVSTLSEPWDFCFSSAQTHSFYSFDQLMHETINHYFMGGLEEKSIKVFNLPDSRYIHILFCHTGPSASAGMVLLAVMLWRRKIIFLAAPSFWILLSIRKKNLNMTQCPKP